MAVEKCKNCGGKIVMQTNYDGPYWMHQVTGEAHCSNGEPGIGLIEMIDEYYKLPHLYAAWSYKSLGATDYTENAILHGLRMQATIHWNNCSNLSCKNCVEVGKSTADAYMIDLAHGRHDLHPREDSEVHSIAFKIHDAAVEAGTHIPQRARPGIMTCTYVSGAGSSEACSCYEKGFLQWYLERTRKIVQIEIPPTPFDPDDMYYLPRYE